MRSRLSFRQHSIASAHTVMSKRKTIVTLIFFFALAVSFAAYEFLRPPKFNGRTLDEWVQAVHPIAAPGTRNPEEEKAFRVCSNAFPHLLAQLERTDGLSLRARVCQRLALLPQPATTQQWLKRAVILKPFTIQPWRLTCSAH